MNREQKKYAMERVAKECEAKLNQLRKKHTKHAQAPTASEKLAAVRQDRVSLKRAINLSTTIGDAFDFSKLQKPEHLDVASYEKEATPVRRQANAIKDAIMLGEDDQTTLKMIDEFVR